MKLNHINYKQAILALAMGVAVTSCQKMERPELKELILDPEPPAYNDLKSFWAFENNLTDEGENDLTPTPVGITYTAGINGQAAKIGVGGYILLPAAGDTVTYDNGYQGFPADTLASLGSYTLSFWMNDPGPVKDGAQGVFSISNSAEFWGNLDLFLENNDNGSEAFLKIHMFNANLSNDFREQWNEIKIPNALNKWTHIAVTYDGNTSMLNVYADGVSTGIKDKHLVYTENGTEKGYGKIRFNNFNGMVLGTYQFQTTPSLTAGAENQSWAKSLNGSLDQFRIYNRALSASEINGLFTSKD